MSTDDRPKLPRFIVSITDTQTVRDGVALNVAQGSNDINDFLRFIPLKKRKKNNPGRTEFEAIMWWFNEQIARLNKTTPTELTFNDEGKEGEL